MAIFKRVELIDRLEKGQRLMGLDIGKKTIGLALSDPGLKIATPHRILWRSKFTKDMEDLFIELKELNVGGLVLGWPLNMDGTQGPRCDAVRDFSHALMRLQDWPICFHDERLSTVAVEKAMLAEDMTRQKRHQRRDALAAGWILQSALDETHQAIV